MSVDLGNYTENLQREISNPDDTFAPGDDFLVGSLCDGFWEARLYGFTPLSPYTCDENGIVTPLKDDTADIGRDLVQLVIFYAGYKITFNRMINLKTSITQKAGPVEQSVAQSATILKAILDDKRTKLNQILTLLSELGGTTVAVFDGLIARDQSYLARDTFWSGFSVGEPSYTGRSGDPWGGW